MGNSISGRGEGFGTSPESQNGPKLYEKYKNAGFGPKGNFTLVASRVMRATRRRPTVPATSGIVAHLFGTKYLGLLYGIVFLSHQIGSFFGAYLGGLFHDLYGSYDYAWYLAIALSVFAAIIHLPIKEEAVLRLKTE